MSFGIVPYMNCDRNDPNIRRRLDASSTGTTTTTTTTTTEEEKQNQQLVDALSNMQELVRSAINDHTKKNYLLSLNLADLSKAMATEFESGNVSVDGKLSVTGNLPVAEIPSTDANLTVEELMVLTMLLQLQKEKALDLHKVADLIEEEQGDLNNVLKEMIFSPQKKGKNGVQMVRREREKVEKGGKMYL